MEQALSRHNGATFDVAIIGGGVNGASAAQELAAKGFSVVLVEKEDFGSGSSGRSSRFLHCGLRYLAPGRSMLDFLRHPARLWSALKMARQSMVAREEFVRTSPEGVRQLGFAYPILREGPYRGWQIDLAFSLLRLIGPKRVPLDYRRVEVESPEGLALAEAADRSRIASFAIYREYQFDWPERFCVDAVLDAERMGAVVLNYTTASLGREGSAGCRELGLTRAASRERAAVRARMVINAGGIWIDDIHAAHHRTDRRYILGTKGSHIVVKLPARYAGMGLATLNSKKEPFYCVPWHDLHFFGPTETPYEADKERIAVTASEQDWLLDEANRMLPGLHLTRADIRMTWAGVRPLTYDETMPFGRRERVIHDLAPAGFPNVLAVTGGPVQGHRTAGRASAREIARRIRPSGAGQAPRYGYGGSLGIDAALASAQDAPLVALIRRAVEQEHAVTFMDILLRRTGLLWRQQLDEAALARFAEAYRSATGVGSEAAGKALSDFRAEYDRLYGVRPPADASSAQGRANMREAV